MRTIFTLILAITFQVLLALNTNISGIVNRYAAVSAVGSNTATIGSFSPSHTVNCGDRILIIQMKGARINTANSASFGDLTAINNAGNYEILTVESVSGSTITFTENLANSYTPSGNVQAVFVPHYDDATVVGTLTALPWDGSIGGVVSIEVEDTLRLNAGIDVSEQGFRGGSQHLSTQAAPNSTTCFGLFVIGNVGTAWVYNNAQRAFAVEKGESIVNFTDIWGKGKLASGGGGGGVESGGGGGGSNAGIGGDAGGGNPASSPFCAGSPDVAGKGGLSLISEIASGKIFLGGGSGAGNNGNTNNYFNSSSEGLPAVGRRGGGIAILAANTIIGNGNAINANGENGYSGPTGVNNFGGSGGGAGGSIIIEANNFATTLNISAVGGAGSTVRITTTNSRRRGAGGGGGGGVAGFSAGSIPAGVAVNTAGGARGLSYYNNTTLSPSHYGTVGGNGTTIFGISIPKTVYEPLNIASSSGSETLTLTGSSEIFINNGILVAVNPNGNNLGSTTVTATLGDNGPFPSLACPSNEDEYFLPRYFDIVPTNQPTSACDVSLYISQTELDNFITFTNAQSASYSSCWGVVNSINDLSVTAEHSSGSREVLIPSATYLACPDAWRLDFSVNEFSRFYIHSKGGLFENNLLPVDLFSFGVEILSENQHKLEWVTVTEINNAGFEVLRSYDGLEFEKIGWVPGKGNSTNTNRYEFIDYLDKNVSQGFFVYYRLKQIDFDSNFEYSPIEVISIGQQKHQEFKVFPNPAKDMLSLKSFPNTIDEVAVYDLAGWLLALHYGSGLNKMQIDTKDLKSGVYLLNVKTGTETNTERLIIQR